MQDINVIVLGHQLADPSMWIKYLADRFKQPVTQEVFHEPDRCLVIELDTAHYRMVTKAPVHALRNEADSYRVLFSQPVDALIYVQSIFVEGLHLIQRDFHIVSRILAEHPSCPPVFTLLNDIFCGKNADDTLLSVDELNAYIIPDSRVFHTSISYWPNAENCAIGADEVFSELLNILNDGGN